MKSSIWIAIFEISIISSHYLMICIYWLEFEKPSSLGFSLSFFSSWFWIHGCNTWVNTQVLFSLFVIILLSFPFWQSGFMSTFWSLSFLDWKRSLPSDDLNSISLSEGIVTRRPLVLQLYRTEKGSEYAEFLPKKRFTDFGRSWIMRALWTMDNELSIVGLNLKNTFSMQLLWGKRFRMKLIE